MQRSALPGEYSAAYLAKLQQHGTLLVQVTGNPTVARGDASLNAAQRGSPEQK